MNDLSKLREQLLQDYIQDFAPSPQEIDAFMRGATWMMDCAMSHENLNQYVPEKACLHRQQHEINELQEDLKRLQKENTRLEKDLTKLTTVTAAERKAFKKENEWKQMKQDMAELQKKIKRLKDEKEKWMNRFLTLTLPKE